MAKSPIVTGDPLKPVNSLEASQAEPPFHSNAVLRTERRAYSDVACQVLTVFQASEHLANRLSGQQIRSSRTGALAYDTLLPVEYCERMGLACVTSISVTQTTQMWSCEVEANFVSVYPKHLA